MRLNVQVPRSSVCGKCDARSQCVCCKYRAGTCSDSSLIDHFPNPFLHRCHDHTSSGSMPLLPRALWPWAEPVPRGMRQEAGVKRQTGLFRLLLANPSIALVNPILRHGARRCPAAFGPQEAAPSRRTHCSLHRLVSEPCPKQFAQEEEAIRCTDSDEDRRGLHRATQGGGGWSNMSGPRCGSHHGG